MTGTTGEVRPEAPAQRLSNRQAVAFAFLASTLASALLYGLAIARSDGPAWVAPLAGIGAGAATLARARAPLMPWALGLFLAVVGVFVGTSVAVWVANLAASTPS